MVNDIYVKVRTTESLKSKIKKAAKKAGVPVSKFMNEMIKNHFKKLVKA